MHGNRGRVEAVRQNLGLSVPAQRTTPNANPLSALFIRVLDDRLADRAVCQHMGAADARRLVRLFTVDCHVSRVVRHITTTTTSFAQTTTAPHKPSSRAVADLSRFLVHTCTLQPIGHLAPAPRGASNSFRRSCQLRSDHAASSRGIRDAVIFTLGKHVAAQELASSWSPTSFSRLHGKDDEAPLGSTKNEPGC